MFEIGEYDPENMTMNFSRGGFQGARGTQGALLMCMKNIIQESF